MTDEALEELARFLPALEKSDFKADEIRGGDQIEPGVFTMPYVHYSDTVSTFVDAASRYNWVSSNFDWPAWAQSTEAAQLRDTEAVLANATPQQIERLLTLCIRQDRFVEGALLNAFESGLILRIVRRAAVIVQEKRS
jgi:hypothetical protein